MTDNLLVLVTISFAAGIGASPLLPANLLYLLWPLLFLIVAALLLTIKNRRHFAENLLLALFLIIGIVHGRQFSAPPLEKQTIYQQITHRQEISLIGVLQEAPAISPEKTTLIMAARELVTPEKTSRATGLAQIRFKGFPPVNLHPGDLFMVRGYFSRPTRFAVPGSFDYPAYLRGKKIFITGWLNSGVNILKIQCSPPSLYHKIRYSPELIRQKINNFLVTTLPARQAGLYKAILTGDRAAVAPDILEDFKTIGCFHLLAISGLHMGLLALIVITAIYWLLKRSTWILLHIPAWKTAVLLALPPLILYGFVAGFHIPVIRALIMTIVLAGAILFDRRMNLAAAIALAALLILFINPTALFSASFQLSFAAVIGLAAVAPLLRRKVRAIKSADNFRQKISKWIILSLLTSIIATVSTAPLAIYHFNRLSLLSPLSTLLIEPLLCFWSLIIGLAGSCFIFIAPLTATFLFKIGGWGIIGATHLAKILAGMPLACIWFTTPSLAEVCCAYIFLICLLCFPKHYLFRFAGGGLLLFLIIWPNWLRIIKNSSEASIVTVLDVGQGCAVVLELSGGKTILLDGGGSRTRKFNVGEALIAPFLWQRRIKNIDDVIISHPDGDHFNGLPFILKRFHPRTLWINGQPGNKLYKILLSQAQEAGIKIKTPEKNCIISQHNDNILLNLTEMHESSRYPNLKDNDRSLIIKFTTAKASFLFPGDIEKEAEKTAVKNNYNLKSDIMLAPHHGSKTSSSKIFLQAVQPEKIIISAAAHKYGTFPAIEVINRYHKQNISILTTSKNGSISYRITPEKISMETFGVEILD